VKKGEFNLRGMAVVSPLAREVHRRERSSCDVPNCRRSTCEQKPYCSEHIQFMPKVSSILAELQSRAAELELVERHPARATAESGHAQEILMRLEAAEGVTVERLASDARIYVAAVRAFIRALKRAKQVRTRKSTRGKTVVSLCR